MLLILHVLSDMKVKSIDRKEREHVNKVGTHENGTWLSGLVQPLFASTDQNIHGGKLALN